MHNMAKLLKRGSRARPPQYRSTANDRDTAPERVIAVAGPIADFDADRVRTLLKKLAGIEPATRISLVPSESRLWEYRELDIEQTVVELPDVDTRDLGRLLTEIGKRAGERRPLEVFICGEHLVVDFSHGIGDGPFGLVLGAALMGAEEEPALARSLAKSLPPHAVWLALGRHFASHPSRIRSMLQLRKSITATVGETDSTRRIDDWKASTRGLSAYMEPARLTELRAWASSHAAGSTSTSVTVALWIAALRGEDVQIDPQVTCLVNCRRYLGVKHRDAHGNFAVGMRMPLPSSPTGIAAMVRQVTDSGWPAAALGYAEFEGWLARRTEPAPPAGTEVANRLRLTVSDLGRLTMFDHVQWATGPRPPQIAAYLQPDGADASTLLVTELAGGRTFTASFCSEMIEPAVIEKALVRICADPVGVLQAARL